MFAGDLEPTVCGKPLPHNHEPTREVSSIMTSRAQDLQEGGQAREWLFRETHRQGPRRDSKFPFYCPRFQSVVNAEERHPATAIPLLKVSCPELVGGAQEVARRTIRSTPETAPRLGATAARSALGISRHVGVTPGPRGSGGSGGPSRLSLATLFLGLRLPKLRSPRAELRP
ncbi:uncharacterized protein RBU33_014514 isoform 1-T1 [Hipposideros larvatus]